MARLSISEAIRQSPIGKSQFYSKYIDGGLITVSVDGTGKKYIDSSELLRVFGEMTGKQSEEVHKQSESDSTVKSDTEQSEVIKLLKEQLSDLRHDVGEREKFYQSQIVSLTNRLEGPTKTNPIVRWWRGLG
jgi:hypothetical protein